MAKIDLKFLDVDYLETSISCKISEDKEIGIEIQTYGKIDGIIYLDKSTAIKFAKTLRTEINKIED